MTNDFSIQNHRSSTYITFSDSLDKVLTSLGQNTCVLYDPYFKNYIPDSAWSIPIHALEGNKNLDYVNLIVKKILLHGFPSNITSIGGGIVQDLSGFISAILKRGVNWTYIPTTFASQADSCIGSKTSINVGSFKNQLGLFYAPTKVVVIPTLLKSLPTKDLYCGLGEVLHYFMQSPSHHNFNLASNFENQISAGPPSKELFLELIKESLKIKSSIIQIDEFDQGIRKVFNFGHTFGHAIEAATKNHVPHGIAVIFGMHIALEISEFSDNELIENYNSLILKCISRIQDSCRCDFDLTTYKDSLTRDKKNSVKDHIAVILPRNQSANPELTIMSLLDLENSFVFEKSISILKKQGIFNL